jgi:hypothetical protein
MVSSVQTKVQRLETAYGGGGGLPPCDRCGWGGDEGEPFDYQEGDTFEVVFYDDTDHGPDSEAEEYCPECGRRINIVVRFEEDLHS